eukprot:scaffold191249_cov30-Tisochrysis_lutea.AAC.2
MTLDESRTEPEAHSVQSLNGATDVVRVGHKLHRLCPARLEASGRAWRALTGTARLLEISLRARLARSRHTVEETVSSIRLMALLASADVRASLRHESFGTADFELQSAEQRRGISATRPSTYLTRAHAALHTQAELQAQPSQGCRLDNRGIAAASVADDIGGKSLSRCLLDQRSGEKARVRKRPPACGESMINGETLLVTSSEGDAYFITNAHAYSPLG